MVQWISHHRPEEKVAVAFRGQDQQWSVPELIPGSNGGKLGETAIRLDEQGIGYVLWHSRVFPKSFLYFSKKDPEKGWSEPFSILTQEDRLKQPFFTFNSKFQPFVLTQYEKDHWEESWAIRYQIGEKVARRFARLNRIKSVSFNRRGYGFAVWTFCQEKSTEGFSTCYDEALQAVCTEEGEKFFTPGVTVAHLDLDRRHVKYSTAVNHQQTGAIIWCSYRGNDYQIFATSGTKHRWSEPRRVSKLDQMPGRPQIAIDDQENLVAAWIVKGQLWTAFQSTHGDWSAPQNLGEACQSFKLDVDSAGHFIILWEEAFAIHGAILEDDEWKSVQLSPADQKCWAPVFVFNSKGEGIAAWMTDLEGTSHIQVTDLSLD